jgi:hypothetical protein
LRNANYTIISIFSAAKKNASGPKPMQIDAAQYKPLLQGEIDQRRRDELCYYCGSSKHRLSKCPIKPKGLKAQSATSIESGTLENGDA